MARRVSTYTLHGAGVLPARRPGAGRSSRSPGPLLLALQEQAISHQDFSRHRIPVALWEAAEPGLLIEVLGRMHVWLGAQHQVPYALADSQLDDRSQERAAGSLTLTVGGYCERPDLSLIWSAYYLSSLWPVLQHDRSENPAVMHGDQDLAVADGSEAAQGGCVCGGGRKESVGLVGGHPEIADHSEFAGKRGTNSHVGANQSGTGEDSCPASDAGDCTLPSTVAGLSR